MSYEEEKLQAATLHQETTETKTEICAVGNM